MKQLSILIHWLTAIILPLILILAGIRLLLTPLFLEIEYQRSGFPPDTYGFTTADRLKWSKISVEYLLNDAGDTFLTSQSLSDNVPLYNEREISHMHDVKVLVQQALSGWYILMALIVVLGLVAWQIKDLPNYWLAVSRGGWITIGLILAMLLGVFLGFDTFFTDFHRIFFKGDTWLFAYSDTLIRLFPIQFWQDAFILVGALSVLGALLFIFGGAKLSRK